jgi:predicted nucleic acid-binding protein
MRQFVDTNVIIYAFVDSEPRYHQAQSFLTAGSFISVQMLNEFANVMNRKNQKSWDWVNEARKQLLFLCAPVIDLTVHIHEEAMYLAERYQLPFSDALILAAALEAKCDHLISKGFKHGQRFGKLTVINPFI